MTNDAPLDMLQIKIDRAKDELPKETRKAIDSVDWRAVILSFREKKGYSFEQLEDLELETELLLCGLLNPVDYPKELEERLKLPRAQVDLLVSEMNELVFKKIKDELIKNTERQEMFIKKETPLPPPASPREAFMASILPITKGEEKGGGQTPVLQNDAPVLSNRTDIETMPPEIPITKETTPLPNLPLTKGEEKTHPSDGQGEDDPGPLVAAESIGTQKLSGSFQIPTSKTEYTLPSLGKDKITKTSIVDPYRIDPNE